MADFVPSATLQRHVEDQQAFHAAIDHLDQAGAERLVVGVFEIAVARLGAVEANDEAVAEAAMEALRAFIRPGTEIRRAVKAVHEMVEGAVERQKRLVADIRLAAKENAVEERIGQGSAQCAPDMSPRISFVATVESGLSL